MIIVENEDNEREFMREGFEASGLFELVALVRNGNELEEWLAANRQIRPDLILSDLNMWGKDGYDIIKYVNRLPEKDRFPVIITSTSTAPSVVSKCLAMELALTSLSPMYLSNTSHTRKSYMHC